MSKAAFTVVMVFSGLRDKTPAWSPRAHGTKSRRNFWQILEFGPHAASLRRVYRPRKQPMAPELRGDVTRIFARQRHDLREISVQVSLQVILVDGAGVELGIGAKGFEHWSMI